MAQSSEDDDLEYHITFPSPVSKDISEEDVPPNDGDSEAVEPVVILLGWGGCDDKHLAKYSAIYEKR